MVTESGSVKLIGFVIDAVLHGREAATPRATRRSASTRPTWSTSAPCSTPAWSVAGPAPRVEDPGRPGRARPSDPAAQSAPACPARSTRSANRSSTPATTTRWSPRDRARGVRRPLRLRRRPHRPRPWLTHRPPRRGGRPWPPTRSLGRATQLHGLIAAGPGPRRAAGHEAGAPPLRPGGTGVTDPEQTQVGVPGSTTPRSRPLPLSRPRAVPGSTLCPSQAARLGRAHLVTPRPAVPPPPPFPSRGGAAALCRPNSPGSPRTRPLDSTPRSTGPRTRLDAHCGARTPTPPPRAAGRDTSNAYVEEAAWPELAAARQAIAGVLVLVLAICSRSTWAATPSSPLRRDHRGWRPGPREPQAADPARSRSPRSRTSTPRATSQRTPRPSPGDRL